MIDLLRALDFGRIVWEILVDGKVEVESSPLVHAFIGLDGQSEVEDVVRVGKRGFHGFAERPFEFREVYSVEEGSAGSLRSCWRTGHGAYLSVLVAAPR